MSRRRTSVEDALFEQACVSLRGGSRFQFRVDEIGGEGQIRRFIVKLSSVLGSNVRANCGHGLITIYDDGKPDGTTVVVAMVKNGSTLK
jgi:hypothetical protein